MSNTDLAKVKAQAAAKEGDRVNVLLSITPETRAFLDQLVAEAKQLRKECPGQIPKNIGRGGVVDLWVKQAMGSLSAKEKGKLMKLGLIEEEVRSHDT